MISHRSDGMESNFHKRFHHLNTSVAANSIHFLSLSIRYTTPDKTNTLSKELSSRMILLLISTAHKTLSTTGSANINFQTISLILQNLLTSTDLKVLKLSLVNKRGIFGIILTFCYR